MLTSKKIFIQTVQYLHFVWDRFFLNPFLKARIFFYAIFFCRLHSKNSINQATSIKRITVYKSFKLLNIMIFWMRNCYIIWKYIWNKAFYILEGNFSLFSKIKLKKVKKLKYFCHLDIFCKWARNQQLNQSEINLLLFSCRYMSEKSISIFSCP